MIHPITENLQKKWFPVKNHYKNQWETLVLDQRFLIIHTRQKILILVMYEHVWIQTGIFLRKQETIYSLQQVAQYVHLFYGILLKKKKRDQTQSTKKWLSVFRPRWPPSLQLCQLSQLPHCLHTLPEKGEGWHSAMGQGKSSANLGSKAIKGQGFPVSCYIRMGFSDDVSTVYPSNRYFKKTGYDP